MSIDIDGYKRILKSSARQIVGWVVFSCVVVVIAFFAVYFYLYKNEISRHELALRQTVEVARAAITPILTRVQNGEISKEYGLNQIQAVIHRMTYTDMYGDNYIFMVTYEGVILSNPYLPEREGTNQWNARDSKGNYYIQELIHTAQQHPGGGYVRYYYPHPSNQTDQEKMSYVVALPGMDAVIGTGLYLNDFLNDQNRFIIASASVSILLLVIVIYPILLSFKRMREANANLIVEATERKKAEENQATIFQKTSDSLLVFSQTGEIFDCNQALCDLFMVEHDDMAGKSVSDLCLQEDCSRSFLDEVRKSLAISNGHLIEIDFVRPVDGQRIFAEASINLIQWNGLDAVFASIRDISDRKRIQDELFRNNLLLEKAQELAHVGHFYYELDTRKITWSKEMYAITGIPLREEAPVFLEQRNYILGEGWLDIQKAREECARTGNKINLDIRIKTPQHEFRDLNLTLEAVRNDKQDIIAVAGAVQDVTERNQVQNALLTAEKRFITAIESLPYEAWAIDEKGIYVIQNTTSQTRWGRFIGKRADDLIPDLIHAANWKLNNERVLKGEVINEEFTRVVDGREYYLLLVYSPIYSQDKIIGGLGMNIDLTGQKDAQRQVLDELAKIGVLREIDQRIISHLDKISTLQFIAEAIRDKLMADAVSIHLMNKEKDLLEPIVSLGYDFGKMDCPNQVEKNSLCWNIYRSNKVITDKDPIFHRLVSKCPCIVQGKFKSYIGMPVVSENGTRGVVEVYFKHPTETGKDLIDYLHTLVGQAAIVLDNAILYSDLERTNQELVTAYEATIAGWSHALELRDKETKGHSDRVLKLATELAKVVGIPPEEMENFKRGVFLHDIGKMGIPDNILLKPGPLTEEEWQIMRQHPQYAYDLLEKVDYLRPALDIPYAHHERWNGTGYPRGLAGEQIPLSARIFAVVDVWDALISDRPYRPGWKAEEVIQYIHENSGVLFDPKVVEMFLEMAYRI
jgi:PAS domain S-box-containing protein